MNPRQSYMRRPERTVTGTLLVLNIIVFLLMEFIGGGTTNSETLLKFGAMRPDLVRDGQYFRFITPIFIHIGFVHLMFNTTFLQATGSTVESIFGKLNFFLIYMLSGIMGNIFSFGFGSDSTISAGASTALYGMLGVMLGFTVFYKHNQQLRRLGSGYILTIIINIIYTLTTPGIGILGHLGGLIGGFLLSGIFTNRYDRPSTFQQLVCLILFICIIFISLAKGGLINI